MVDRTSLWHNQLIAVFLAFALTVGMISGGSLALCGIGGALLLYALDILQRRRLLLLAPAAIGFGLGFLALVLLADATALAFSRSAAMSWRLVSIVLPLMLLFRHPAISFAAPQWLVRILPWVMFAVMGLLLVDFYNEGNVLLALLHKKDERMVYYNRGLSYAAVLLWPLVGWLGQAGRWRVAAGLVFGLLMVTWFSTSRGAVLALVVGAGFWLLGRYLPRLGGLSAVGLLAVVAVGSLVAVPWLFDHHPTWFAHLPSSWHHRVEIWDYLLAWHLPSPWLGWGADVAVLAPLNAGHQSQYLHAVVPAAHPHHAFLQLWLELGILGWGWAVALALYLLWQLRQWPPVARASGLAAWAAFLTLACGSFNLWSDSFWATGALVMVALPKSGKA